MFNTVYVLERDPAECRWIESALAGQVRKLIFLEDGATLLDWLATQGGDCLLCGAEPDASVALELVRRLRRHGRRVERQRGDDQTGYQRNRQQPHEEPPIPPILRTTIIHHDTPPSICFVMQCRTTR